MVNIFGNTAGIYLIVVGTHVIIHVVGINGFAVDMDRSEVHMYKHVANIWEMLWLCNGIELQ